jgi:hypothetical protein
MKEELSPEIWKFTFAQKGSLKRAVLARERQLKPWVKAFADSDSFHSFYGN